MEAPSDQPASDELVPATVLIGRVSWRILGNALEASERMDVETVTPDRGWSCNTNPLKGAKAAVEEGRCQFE